MSINTFYYHPELSLDLRANTSLSEVSSMELQETGRILTESMNVLNGYDEDMEICGTAVPRKDIQTSDYNFTSIFQRTFSVNNHLNLQKNARLLELRKEIIGSEQIDANGNIISLNFSKNFFDNKLLIEEILQHLEEIFCKKDIYNTVRKIILRNNNLNKLPRSIIRFTNLKSIDLNNNRFTTIPSEIYSFKKLKKLSIKNNFITHISGQIGRLKRLEEINLSKNKIRCLHPSLSKLKNIYTLNLSNNLLDNIPKWISKFHNLEFLNISSNNIYIIIPEIFVKRLENLDLSNNYIDVIPSAIKNSSNLVHINFDYNEIVNIPDEVGNLSHLRGAYFNENVTLRGFSDKLYNLLPNCTVEIDNSGIALSTLLEIQSKLNEINYNGPQFEFSIDAAKERLEERLMDLLYVYTDRNPPKAFINLRHMSDHLEMWLNRLDWMSDFQNVEKSLVLRENIIDCIEYAEVNSEYYKLFQNIVEGATATCGDGIALSIIDIGIAKEILTFIEGKKMEELTHFLLGTVFPRQILQKIAGQKITLLKLDKKKREEEKGVNTHSIDDVEIYLTYPILLKKRLNLSININAMFMERTSTGVTEKDLEVAATEVEKQQADKEACAEFLIKNTYWIELLKKLHSKEYEAIHEQSIEMMMDESEEAAQEYRRNSLIALSGIKL